MREATSPESWIGEVLRLLVPAFLAVACFFSWIMLVDGLQIQYYLYYDRTIYLIYFGRTIDPIVWLLSSVLALILLACAVQGPPASLWSSILLLWFGISLGALDLVGVLGHFGPLPGALLTLTGCVLGANAAMRGATSNDRNYLIAVVLLVLSLLTIPAELGSLSYYVLSAFQPGIQVGRSWETLELQLWYVASPLIPFLYATFLFSWIWAPLVAKLLRKSMRADHAKVGVNIAGGEGRSWVAATAGYVLLSIFLGYYPYFRPSYPLVGTDIYWRYVLPAERVLSSTSWTAAAQERHPLIVMAIALLSRFSGLAVESLLRFAYVAITLAFGGAIFVLVYAVSRSKTLAAFGALVVTVSPPTAAGIFNGTVAE